MAPIICPPHINNRLATKQITVHKDGEGIRQIQKSYFTILHPNKLSYHLFFFSYLSAQILLKRTKTVYVWGKF